MTDQGIADRIYIEPLSIEVVERIIEAERPDGILPTLGGQTGLNLAVALADAGVLEKYGVRLLGTPLETIRTSEDRDFFRNFLHDIGRTPNLRTPRFPPWTKHGKRRGLSVYRWWCDPRIHWGELEAG